MSADSEAKAEIQLVTREESDRITMEQSPKLIRIASMTRAMLEEIRQAPLDDGGRRRLVDIYRQSVAELDEMLPEDLRSEFNELFVPIEKEKVTEAELRIAQAQLVGWLEGLFAGIQASVWSQHAAAAEQLQQVRQRAIEAGGRPGDSPGQYL